MTTGLWDSQVQYFEPVKWAAKLRVLKTDRRPVLLHVNLDAGHGGKTGRFEHLREVAREYAFVVAVARGGLGACGAEYGQQRAAEASASGLRSATMSRAY
jgi:oligopeptidase B